MTSQLLGLCGPFPPMRRAHVDLVFCLSVSPSAGNAATGECKSMSAISSRTASSRSQSNGVLAIGVHCIEKFWGGEVPRTLIWIKMKGPACVWHNLQRGRISKAVAKFRSSVRQAPRSSHCPGSRERHADEAERPAANLRGPALGFHLIVIND